MKPEPKAKAKIQVFAKIIIEHWTEIGADQVISVSLTRSVPNCEHPKSVELIIRYNIESSQQNMRIASNINNPSLRASQSQDIH